MLHGFTGSPASFARLAMPRGALAPVLGGHLAEPARFNYWEEVDRLAAFDPGATRLFGYSLGGRLALGLLARYPQRYERAVLASAHPGLRTDAQRMERCRHDDGFVRLLREGGLARFVAAWEAQPLWCTQRGLPAAVRSAKHRERLLHTAEGLSLSLGGVGLGRMPDLRAALRSVACPVQFVAGGSDGKFVALAEEMCAILPRARLHVAAGAGHDLVLERPEVCSAFLSQGDWR
jgi:2-succinyl-6-hydroxy-2,4-cyclohexadiene-1-carboxylate synthase